MNIYLTKSSALPVAYELLAKTLLSQAGHQLVDDAFAADLRLSLENQVTDAKVNGLAVAVVDLQKLADNTRATLEAAKPVVVNTVENAKAATETSGVKNIVAVTACPTGVAHTFMSAEAIEAYCKSKGWNIKVETRGQQGVGNPLSPEEVAAADLVFAATDIEVDLSKFEGRPFYHTSTKAALKNTAQEFEKAFAQAKPYQSKVATSSSSTETAKSEGGWQAIYRHLMTGVSHMLPITVAGGLLIALSFLFGPNAFQEEGTLPAALMTIGGGSAFAIMLAVFSGYVAYSIADRPGLASGLITGFLVTNLGAGFLGAIVTGFLSGYVTLFLSRSIKLPPSITSLKPILILPLLSTLIVGLLTVYLIGPYVSVVSQSLSDWLTSLQGGSALVLGLILGAMMCIDMGGPINKAAYVVSVGLISQGVTTPMAAVMAAGMVPPIGMAIATWIARRKFTAPQRDSGNVAFVLGLCFISEGAIPFAAADPLRVIASSALGGAIAGAISMLAGVQLNAPHGGVLVAFTVNHVLTYFVAIAVGSIVTGVLYAILKAAPKAEAKA
ncbi:PTS fructose transporter subunit EIIBC [Psittacicella melopsittaci]|uniref:protein-N(pi)-phosphohistidine--D-fructose phosphotransferase n=1 Tax=Psittacicella melopsittaci TaxID=2028576 RepID=A0A3A1Y505_9GAMM|nr:fructose-specific PTS transporter subunit EIIC [Psittacicella melopsittaci]RIY32655.1 PTS fructose transporter subunit EIIBC [Psittacicella melopsittaci]